MDGGKEGEEQILATLAQAGAPRATTTITAIQRAFDALDARRIVLITPYSADTTEHEAEFLRQAGYDVLSAKGFALAGSDAYCAAPPQFWRDRAIEAAHPDADAYLISCANISVFGVIRELEARLERPVVTSNQAVIWDALRLLNWRGSPCLPGTVVCNELDRHTGARRKDRLGRVRATSLTLRSAVPACRGHFDGGSAGRRVPAHPART